MASGNIYNKNDSMDINELAALNEADFSPEYLEQLQEQITKNSEASKFSEKKEKFDEKNDATLFEEIPTDEKENESTKVATEATEEASEENKNTENEVSDTHDSNKPKEQNDKDTESPELPEDKNSNSTKEQTGEKHSKKASIQSFDDNFIKKYKAKLNKQNTVQDVEDTSLMERSKSEGADEKDSINELSNGNIVERDLTQEQIDYSNSLDFLDGNIKYSKYVIYIDPENVDFIESLTVKERKNLINRIIREQDDIRMTKNRFRIFQAVINHILIAIFTLSVSVPILYYTLNASLEATIDNYRRSQTNFQILYKNHGKISNKN